MADAPRYGRVDRERPTINRIADSIGAVSSD
jgi:hypothetical protein